MLFNSVHFLIFFPIVTVFYFLIPHRFRWIWLLVISYYFYMSWNPKYALLMAASTLITYLSGILIGWSGKNPDQVKGGRQKKLWVSLSFGLNLSILFFFKYFWFAVDNLNIILGKLNVQMVQPSFDVLLPVGISFYTFQALSYTMDVYRGDIYAERNPFKYALFVSFFPQLVAGPIERSKNLLIQINERHIFDYEQAKTGLLWMAWGYFQKLVIADRAAILVNEVFQHYEQYQGLQIAVGVVLFALQIYCDFSGYSCIAIGAALIMGFRLMINFRQPYYSLSIKEFWHRWHISLSTWFRDYLYIPLGGNRCTPLRRRFNLMITFLASGLWHGASWNFVIWGGLHGLFQLAEEKVIPLVDKLNCRIGKHGARALVFFRMLLTFLLVDFAWIFFRAPLIKDAWGIIARLFRGWAGQLMGLREALRPLGQVLDLRNMRILITACLILLAADYISARVDLKGILSRQKTVVRWLFYYGAMTYILFYGVVLMNNSNAEFIYFQF